MTLFKELIGPVSPERLDENRVRVTALGAVVIMGTFLITGIWLISQASRRYFLHSRSADSIFAWVPGIYLPGLSVSQEESGSGEWLNIICTMNDEKRGSF